MSSAIVPRVAGQRLLDRAIIHDLGESLAMAGLITVPQLLSEESDKEALAIQAAAGVGAAMATRPLARRAGRAVGRQIDKRPGATQYPTDTVGYFQAMQKDPSIFKHLHKPMNMLASSRDTMHSTAGRMMTDYAGIPAWQAAVLKNVDPVRYTRAKAYNTVDGKVLNGMEADLGVIAGAFGDNVAQALVQLGLGSALAQQREEQI